MKKILVTGSDGQLGSELKALANTDFKFIFTSSGDLDITDREKVQEFVSQHKPDFVINCAAYTAVDKAEAEQEKALAVNKTGVLNLADACFTHAAQLIHISTDFVFDGSSALPYLETDEPAPTGHYGYSKLMGEKEALAIDPQTIIVRTSWLYSPFGHNFLKTMVRLGTESEEVRVVFDQVGTPTYAHDLAGALLSIMKSGLAKENSGIYHYSNEGVASWYDFAKAIFSIAEIETRATPVRTSAFPTPASRPAYSVLDKTKIKNTFGLSIPYWYDSVEKCISRLKH